MNISSVLLLMLQMPSVCLALLALAVHVGGSDDWSDDSGGRSDEWTRAAGLVEAKARMSSGARRDFERAIADQGSSAFELALLIAAEEHHGTATPAEMRRRCTLRTLTIAHTPAVGASRTPPTALA